MNPIIQRCIEESKRRRKARYDRRMKQRFSTGRATYFQPRVEPKVLTGQELKERAQELRRMLEKHAENFKAEPEIKSTEQDMEDLYNSDNELHAHHQGYPTPGGPRVTPTNYEAIRAGFSVSEFKLYRQYLGPRTGVLNAMEAVSLVLLDSAAARKVSSAK